MGRTHVYAHAITEPGSTSTDALPMSLGDTAGGNIDPAGDEDYFSITIEETSYVTIGGVSEVTNISGDTAGREQLPGPRSIRSTLTICLSSRAGWRRAHTI